MIPKFPVANHQMILNHSTTDDIRYLSNAFESVLNITSLSLYIYIAVSWSNILIEKGSHKRYVTFTL